jgi:cytochrome c biogenesis protein CcmG, thiol:disulfide interchange protein DsbE
VAQTSSEPPAERARRRLWLRRLLQTGAVLVVALLLTLLVLRTVDKGSGPHFVAQVKAGAEPLAPDFDLPVLWPHGETWPAELRDDLAGGRIARSDLRGYAVVLNFWASWCVPCKSEAPRLVASAKRHAGAVVFLGIDVQDFESDARRFLERYQTNYVSVRDGGDATYSAYGLTGLPETYFLDARGRVLVHKVGEISPEELEAGVASALAGG